MSGRWRAGVNTEVLGAGLSILEACSMVAEHMRFAGPREEPARSDLFGEVAELINAERPEDRLRDRGEQAGLRQSDMVGPARVQPRSLHLG